MDISIALIRKCKNKDREAFDILLGHYEKQLYNICYSYTRDHQKTMDIMQEVFIKIFRSIDSFDESRTIWPWLKTIAVNTCLNYTRDNKKHQSIPLESINNEQPDMFNLINSQTNLEDEVIIRDMNIIIEEAIRELPDSYRMAITLRYKEDMTYKEISSIMDQPLGTVKSNICRARTLLKNRFKNSGLLEV